MPIFEYSCTKCGLRFERIVPNDKAKVSCPKCGSEKAEKLLSSFSFSSGGRGRGACGPSGST